MLCGMKTLYLSLEEKERLEKEHALKENGKERDRIKANYCARKVGQCRK